MSWSRIFVAVSRKHRISWFRDLTYDTPVMCIHRWRVCSYGSVFESNGPIWWYCGVYVIRAERTPSLVVLIQTGCNVEVSSREDPTPAYARQCLLSTIPTQSSDVYSRGRCESACVSPAVLWPCLTEGRWLKIAHHHPTNKDLMDITEVTWRQSSRHRLLHGYLYLMLF